jgi:hypothetical protein
VDESGIEYWFNEVVREPWGCDVESGMDSVYDSRLGSTRNVHKDGEGRRGILQILGKRRNARVVHPIEY